LILGAVKYCGHIRIVKRTDIYSNALNTVVGDMRKLVVVCEKMERY
jgi:hypothetical protein